MELCKHRPWQSSDVQGRQHVQGMSQNVIQSYKNNGLDNSTKVLSILRLINFTCTFDYLNHSPSGMDKYMQNQISQMLLLFYECTTHSLKWPKPDHIWLESCLSGFVTMGMIEMYLSKNENPTAPVGKFMRFSEDKQLKWPLLIYFQGVT